MVQPQGNNPIYTSFMNNDSDAMRYICLRLLETLSFQLTMLQLFTIRRRRTVNYQSELIYPINSQRYIQNIHKTEEGKREKQIDFGYGEERDRRARITNTSGSDIEPDAQKHEVLYQRERDKYGLSCIEEILRIYQAVGTIHREDDQDDTESVNMYHRVERDYTQNKHCNRSHGLPIIDQSIATGFTCNRTIDFSSQITQLLL